MSIWHWIIALIWIVGFGVPIAKILGRLGISKWFTLLAFVPVLNIVALWVLANVKWPSAEPRDS